MVLLHSILCGIAYGCGPRTPEQFLGQRSTEMEGTVSYTISCYIVEYDIIRLQTYSIMHQSVTYGSNTKRQ